MSEGFVSAFLTPELTLWKGFVLVGILVVGSVTAVILQELWYFLFPRRESIKQNFPFHGVYLLATEKDHQLELVSGFIDTAYQTAKRKTAVFQSALLPSLVVTTDINNVQHVLKDNFKNYGKTGPNFKPRLQGLLGNGIFNSDGQQWYAHRKTSAHLFKMNKFKGNILDVFNDDLNQLISVIDSKITSKESIIDIHDYLHRFTLESISRVAFGIPLGCIIDTNINFAKDFDYCTMIINDSFVNPLWWFERYFTPKGWKYFYYLSRINSYAKKIITERREEVAKGEGLNKNDLLTLYLDKDSFKEVLGNGGENATQDHLDTFMEPTDNNLRDVILNMIIAGRDTTAQALSWAFYRMCIHPETQKKLREEVKEVLSQSFVEGNKQSEYDLLVKHHGQHPVSFNALQQLKYVEGFCMEVLRLHPSVPKEAKEVFAEDTLPDGTKVYPGDLLSFVPWAMGRDTDLWGKDANEFHPERFIDQPKPNPFKFIAFQVAYFVYFCKLIVKSFYLIGWTSYLSRAEFRSIRDEVCSFSFGISIRVRPCASS